MTFTIQKLYSKYDATEMRRKMIIHQKVSTGME